jgi:hypothetical protein
MASVRGTLLGYSAQLPGSRVLKDHYGANINRIAIAKGNPGRFAWLARADRDGTLAGFLTPDLSPAERAVALVEGWILGVPGLIRTGGKREASPSAACDPSVFRLH